jgi:hypothetical protein
MLSSVSRSNSTSSSFDSSEESELGDISWSRFKVESIMSEKPPSRRASLATISNNKAYTRSISAMASVTTSPQHTLNHYLTKEKVPNIRNYRESIDMGEYHDGKRKPTPIFNYTKVQPKK